MSDFEKMTEPEKVRMMKEAQRCPSCGSAVTMYRKTDKVFWCRRCPAEWKVEPKKK